MSKNELCIENIAVPPTDLFEKKMLKQPLTVYETKQVYDFSLTLTYLQDYGSTADKASTEYIAQFFSYLCERYDDYLTLPNELKSSFDVAHYSHENAFMSTAYKTSNCSDSFMDSFMDSFGGDWV